jgi:hypothetical protein
MEASTIPFVPSPTRLRIVCISDTHNDDCTPSLPNGDVLIHAGDMTDDGTMEELQKAYDWISKLPHGLKIIIAGNMVLERDISAWSGIFLPRAGNHDLGLDRDHKDYLSQAFALFTSDEAKSAGILYIDRAVKTLPQIYPGIGSSSPILVYGNPTQPDFLNKGYAFTYPPSPSPGSAAAWAECPGDSSVPIWVTHGPPLGRLDWIPLPPLTGCAVEAEAVAKAKPVLVVFGHYHISHGAEVVAWERGSTRVAEVTQLARDGQACRLDFTADHMRFERGERTIFVNAAWMTMDKKKALRYQPIVIDIPVDMLTG